MCGAGEAASAVSNLDPSVIAADNTTFDHLRGPWVETALDHGCLARPRPTPDSFRHGGLSLAALALRQKTVWCGEREPHSRPSQRPIQRRRCR